jgi:hypothetical protein
MCSFFSCIVTKSGDVLFDELEDSHEKIIEKYKDKYDLRDNETEPNELRFARVEILPPSGDVFADLKSWTFKIDQQIKPAWFTPTDEKKCMKTLNAFLKKALLIGKKIEKEFVGRRLWVKDCRLICKNSILVLFGSSSAELKGSSRAELWGSSSAVIRESSSAVLMGSSRAELMESSSAAKLKENAIAVIRYTANPEIVVANDKISIEVQK